jgi:hypothetical protein
MFLLPHVLQIDGVHHHCWFHTGMVISKSIQIFIQEKLKEKGGKDEMNCMTQVSSCDLP